ncbi:MAG: glutathione-dependent formaldehyde dehydrogenase [Actinomycetota bacterium]|nr:glutathione-dependent formaldehyde dehydrogenase [Actinomycetota bacterium]
MKAVTWQGKHEVKVEEVPDPRIEQPTDAVIKVTASGLCGSDLHLYDKMWPVLEEGEILGHEPVGVVEEVGSAVGHIAPGDLVVVPFNISCGSCFYCQRQLYSQCETTQNSKYRKGASLFGYTRLYGGVPGGQAEYLRVPQAHFGPIKAPEGVPDPQLVLLADVLPTAWQAVKYADVPKNETVAVFGLGPIGQMSARIALHLGASRIIGVDQVPERLAMAERHGVETLDFSQIGDIHQAVLEMTSGRGADAVIDAVGMEAAGSLADSVLQTVKVQADKLVALHQSLGSVRRGGTVSIIGVYVGAMQMFPLGDLLDKQITLRMGQANVRRWTDQLLPLVTADGDPLGLADLVTHVLPLEEAPAAYEMFQEKRDGAIKVILTP